MEFIGNIPVLNLVVISIAVIVIVVIVLTMIKQFSVNLGDKSITFSNGKQKSEAVRIATEYADFKHILWEELHEGENDLYEQAKWFVELQAHHYMQRLMGDYFLLLGDSPTDRTTAGVFPMMMDIFRHKMVKFFMSVYVENHLGTRDDAQLRDLAKVEYTRMADLFRENVLLKWLPTFSPYDALRDVCMRNADFAMGITYEILDKFRFFSKKRLELVNFVNELDSKIRTDFQETGKLPTNYASSLSNLYIKGVGLNQSVVDSWKGE